MSEGKPKYKSTYCETNVACTKCSLSVDSSDHGIEVDVDLNAIIPPDQVTRNL